MLKDIVKVKPLKNFHLHLEFEDGAKGDVDIRKLVKFRGVFEPLKDEDFFAQVDVNPEWGTIFWPNGADRQPLRDNSQQREENDGLLQSPRRLPSPLEPHRGAARRGRG
jgi:hypothetical protein